MRDRTADLLNANQALSQLSYSPMSREEMVGLGRLELPTSPLSGVRSNQLSYRPITGPVTLRTLLHTVDQAMRVSTWRKGSSIDEQ